MACRPGGAKDERRLSWPLSPRRPSLRFSSPLIEPDGTIWVIRLSDGVMSRKPKDAKRTCLIEGPTWLPGQPIDPASGSLGTMPPLRFILVALAGWMNQQQREVIDYLQEENRVLREQLGPRRLRFTDAQRCRLAAKAKTLGRRVLRDIATIVTPEPCWAGIGG